MLARFKLFVLRLKLKAHNIKQSFLQSVFFRMIRLIGFTAILILSIYLVYYSLDRFFNVNVIALIAELELRDFENNISQPDSPKSAQPDSPKSDFLLPVHGSITSRVGNRYDVFGKRQRYHPGIDIAAAIGVPIKASRNGVVTFAGKKGAYGNLVIIKHSNKFSSRYGHLSRFNVKKGMKLSKGYKIGEVGNTGRSTGPHLHFEIRKSGIPQKIIDHYIVLNQKASFLIAGVNAEEKIMDDIRE